jgi:hypothetical protein
MSFLRARRRLVILALPEGTHGRRRGLGHSRSRLARSGDLPFEEPISYALVTNPKAVYATGIGLPVSFVALGEEVIE